MLPELFTIAEKGKRKKAKKRTLFYKAAAIIEESKGDTCYPFLEKVTELKISHDLVNTRYCLLLCVWTQYF